MTGEGPWNDGLVLGNPFLVGRVQYTAYLDLETATSKSDTGSS